MNKYKIITISSLADVSDESYLLLLNINWVGKNDVKKTDFLFAPTGELIEDINDVALGSKVQCLDCAGYYVTPKIVEQHIHGAFGINFNNCSIEEIIEFAKRIFDYGVGVFYPTVMTDSIENINLQIKKINKARKFIESTKNVAHIGGINLEGPFLNPMKRGIHPIEHLLEPTKENLDKLDLSEVKILTLAPELANGIELIKLLSKKNIISSIGHSTADCETTQHALSVGAKLVTHLFNAMPALHHRTSNLTSQSLINDCYVEVIADLAHVGKDFLGILFSTKNKNKIIFVSDALPIAHSNLTGIMFADEEIFPSDGCAKDKNGTFAGSMMLLCDVYANLHNKLNLDFVDFIHYSAYNSRELLKLKFEIRKDTICFWDKEKFNVDVIKS